VNKSKDNYYNGKLAAIYSGLNGSKLSDNIIRNTNCIMLYNCSNFIIQDIELTKSSIFIVKSKNIEVRNTIISNQVIGFFSTRSENIVLENNIIKNCTYGFHINVVEKFLILNNTISYSEIGIDSKYMDNSKLSLNTIEKCNYGIDCWKIYDNVFDNNTINSNSIGIDMSYCGRNKIENNMIINNIETGIQSSMYGYSLIIAGNYFKNNKNGTFAEDSKVTIIYNKFQNNINGVILYGRLSKPSKIYNNSFYENKIGIIINDSSFNILYLNKIHYNNIGILLLSWENGPTDNKIHMCNIFNNTKYGIYSDLNVKPINNASNNFWGNYTGPYHFLDNVLGNGDKVYGNITIKPWAIEEFNISTDYPKYDNIPDDQDIPQDSNDNKIEILLLFVIFGIIVILGIYLIFKRKQHSRKKSLQDKENNLPKKTMNSKSKLNNRKNKSKH
jgi:parallel beta-helix repeat protein